MSLSLITSSCSQDTEGAIYDMPQGKDNVSFITAIAPVEIAPKGTETSFDLLIAHANKTVNGTTATIGMTATTDIAKIFTLKNPNVTFRNGVSTENIEIQFDRNALAPGVTYTFDLEITSPQSKDNVYPLDSVKTIITKMTVNVALGFTWVKIGSGEFTSEIFGESWDQDIQQAKEVPTFYRFPDLYVKGYSIIFEVNPNDNKIIFNKQKTGTSEGNYGAAYITMPAVTYPDQPAKNGNIFDLWCRYVVDAGSFGTFHEVFELTETE